MHIYNQMDKKEFGKYFAYIRKKSGFKSQRQLSSASGVNNATIARIEDGSQKVKPIFWLSIWDGFFKVSFHFPEKMREELVTLSLREEIKEKIKTLQ